MRTNSCRIFSGMIAALCGIAMLSVAGAAEKKVSMEAFDDLDLSITEDAPAAETELGMDDLLALPPIEEAAPASNDGLSIAKNPASDANVTDATLDVPAANVPATPVLEMPADTPAKTEKAAAPGKKAAPISDLSLLDLAQAPAATAPAVEAAPAPQVEVIPADALPKVEKTQSVVTETVPAPAQAAAAPAPIAANQPVPGNAAAAYQPVPQGMVPGTINGNCRNCQGNGPAYVTYPGPGRRGIIYGTQRNGYAAYPRRECPGGNCGNGPMPYPYYTLRGPRDFDTPNPRPIGP